jgi:hypothetical protein
MLWCVCTCHRRFDRNASIIAMATCAALLLGCWQWWRFSSDSDMADEQNTRDANDLETSDRNSPETDPGSQPKPEGEKNQDPATPNQDSRNDSNENEKPPRRQRPPRTRREAERRWLAAIEKSEQNLLSAIDRLAEMFDDMTLEMEARRLAPDRQYVLTRIPKLISDSEGPQHAAAVGLLAELAGPDTVELLTQIMRRDEASRDRLLPKVIAHTDSLDLYTAYRLTSRRDERVSVLIALASRGDDVSTRALLACVAIGVDEDVNLKELIATRNQLLPERFLNVLADNDAQVRWGACVALASVAEAKQIAKLQQMVLSNHHSLVAMETLIMVDSKESRRFVTAVSRDVRFSGVLRSAVSAVTQKRKIFPKVKEQRRLQ